MFDNDAVSRECDLKMTLIGGKIKMQPLKANDRKEAYSDALVS